MRKHKWLAVVLAVAMMLGMFSAAAFASEIAGTKNSPDNPDTGENSFYPGDIIYYTMTVYNPEDNTETNLLTRIWDTLPNGDIIEFLPPGGTLAQAPGDSETYNTTYVVDWDDRVWSQSLGYYIVQNQFEAMGDDTAGDPVRLLVARNSRILPLLSLGDFVWNDLDRDGIQDAGEPGIAGVTVNLWSASGGAPLAIIDTTTTDINGYYLFDELKAGYYFVQFELPDGDWVFTAKYQGTDITKDSNANPDGITDIINLTATDLTIDAGLYLLDYELTVFKTVETTYVREHEWAIDKWVTTENGDTIPFEDESIPKIWLTHDTNPDETATWHVKVTYVGYEDKDFNISGDVTIENTGEVDVVISSVTDVLAGAPVTVVFPVTFPYTLPVGATLIGTYDEDVLSKVTGTNDVTVTTDRQLTFPASETIVWGDPASELLDEVNIEDDSDLFDVVHLGTLLAADFTAGQFHTYTYPNTFAYTDYTTPGPHIYENTATILETGLSASAILDVNWVPNEELLVTKTAVPTYTRTHEWDIDKWVETENGIKLDDGTTPKIWLYADSTGDETATWYVDVTHVRHRDSDFNVAGTITITNTGNVAAHINSVVDEIDGVPVVVSGPDLPYMLAVGTSVDFTYDALVPGMAESNIATVTTAEGTYTGTKAIVWGDPTTEVNKTVNIKDVSGLFGEVDLGSVTAPNGYTFTYQKPFAWTDYDAPGPRLYENTAIIVETGQYDEAILAVNWIGTEELLVTKTAVTTYTRTHEWDIDKKVETDNELLLDGTPKIWLYSDGIGDETATWTVDVTYRGYTDSRFNVTGTITVENTGDLDAVITSVTDVVGGVNATITGFTPGQILAAGATVEFTYSAAVTDMECPVNTATVTTERDTYTGDADVVWGAPTTEPFKVVDIEDLNSEFGWKDLGTLDAALLAVNQVTTFTYDNDFAWADYSFGDHEEMVITNTATIVQTGQNASAILKVNWIPRELCYEADTAWAFGNIQNNRVPGNRGNAWGWTNGPLAPGTYTNTLWAGAGQNDTSKGTDVGTVTIVYTGTSVTVTYTITMEDAYLSEIHLWVGSTPLPLGSGRNPAPTAAPGQFPWHAGDGEFNATFTTWTITLDESQFTQTADGEIYVAAHSVVMIPVPCE